MHLLRRVDAGAPVQQEPHYRHVAVFHRDHESCPAVLRGRGICGAGRVKGAAAEGGSWRCKVGMRSGLLVCPPVSAGHSGTPIILPLLTLPDAEMLRDNRYMPFPILTLLHCG